MTAGGDRTWTDGPERRGSGGVTDPHTNALVGTVLVGVDASAASRRAVHFAAELARTGRCGLVLAHVIPWSPYSVTTLEDNEARHAERQHEIDVAEKELLSPLREEAEGAGARVIATVVRHGHIAETLMAFARENGAREVIVGRTGDSRLRSLIFGSTPAHLVQVCTIPVTVVP